MRKIVSAKQKRNKIIVSVILILVMFFSVVGYGFYGQTKNSDEDKIEYNGFEFIKNNNFWFVEVEDFVFRFVYNPNEVNEIASDLKYLDNYQDKPLYIYSENVESEIEISANLQQIVQRIQYACLNKEECEGDFPIKTCEDNFIIIQKSENNEIIQEDNCVFIKGEEDKLLELSDDFLFYILNIR